MTTTQPTLSPVEYRKALREELAKIAAERLRQEEAAAEYGRLAQRS